MVENFGGSILYLILFLIQLLGLSFYSYLVILNPKKIIDGTQIHVDFEYDYKDKNSFLRKIIEKWI